MGNYSHCLKSVRIGLEFKLFRGKGQNIRHLQGTIQYYMGKSAWKQWSEMQAPRVLSPIFCNNLQKSDLNVPQRDSTLHTEIRKLNIYMDSKDITAGAKMPLLRYNHDILKILII